MAAVKGFLECPHKLLRFVGIEPLARPRNHHKHLAMRSKKGKARHNLEKEECYFNSELLLARFNIAHLLTLVDLALAERG